MSKGYFKNSAKTSTWENAREENYYAHFQIFFWSLNIVFTDQKGR